MKKLFFAGIFLLLSSALMALEFEYAYGYYSCFDDIQKNERGFEAIPTSDGGYAITGYTTNLAGNRDVMLVKTNAKGDTLWTRTYGGDYDDEGRSMKQLSDGSYVILAMSKSFGASNSANWWTIRVSAIGDLIWSHHTGNEGADEPARVLVSSSDAIYVAGTYYGGAMTTGDTYDGYLEKLNTSTGEMEWVESIHYGTHEYIYNAAWTASGDILLIGAMNDSDNGGLLTTFVVRVSSAGERRWLTKYPNEKENYGYGITELPNGELITVSAIQLFWSGCETRPKGHFKRLSSGGAELYSANFNSCGEYVPRDVIAVSGDEFVVAAYGGRVSNGGSQTSILAKYDTTMTELWIRAFGGRDRWNGFYSVVQTNDGGFLAGGYLTMRHVVNNSPRYDEQLSILKTDANGKADQVYFSKNTVVFEETYTGCTVYDTVFYTNRGFYPLHFYNGLDDPYSSPIQIHSGQYGNQTLQPNAVDTAWTIFKFTPPDTQTYSNRMWLKWEWTPNSMGRTLYLPLSGEGILPPDPELTLSADSLFFGECMIGESKTDSVQIQNSGEVALLTISSTEISAENAYFAIIEGNVSSPVTLQPGEFHQVKIQFMPQAMGVLPASLSIQSDAPSSPDSVSLIGTGLLRQLSFSVQNLAFGNIPLGESGMDSLTITNSGNTVVTLDSLMISAGAEFFVITSGALEQALTLEAGAEHVVTVTFTPLQASAYTGEMQLFSNATDSPHLFPLTGRGVVPELSILPTSLNFGEIQVSEMKADSVILTNSGEAPLQLYSLSLSGDTTFSIIGGFLNDEIVLYPQETHTVMIGYLPMEAVAHAAYLIIEHSADSSPDSVLLSGQGIQGIATLSADSLDFGAVYIDSIALDSLNITNTGNGTLTLYPVSLEQYNGYFQVYDGTFSDSLILEPEESHLFVLSFIPTTEGPESARFIIPHNGESQVDTVLLSGTGSPWLGIGISKTIPESFHLGQNYPNPFNPVTVIPFALPEATFVSLKIYNLSGQLVATILEASLPADYYQIDFSPAQYRLASGVYLFSIQAGEFHAIRKLVYLK